MDREQILLSLRERIVAFAASRLVREAAEDVAQDVLLLLHEKYAQVDRMEELIPLSLHITRFKILDHHRKARRRGEYNQLPIEDARVADPGRDPEAEAERTQMLERVETALLGLGERCRRLFLWKLQGKTFVEIQTLFGAASINTIYTWDFRCRKELLARMGGRWE